MIVRHFFMRSFGSIFLQMCQGRFSHKLVTSSSKTVWHKKYGVNLGLVSRETHWFETCLPLPILLREKFLSYFIY